MIKIQKRPYVIVVSAQVRDIGDEDYQHDNDHEILLYLKFRSAAAAELCEANCFSEEKLTKTIDRHLEKMKMYYSGNLEIYHRLGYKRHLPTKVSFRQDQIINMMDYRGIDEEDMDLGSDSSDSESKSDSESDSEEAEESESLT